MFLFFILFFFFLSKSERDRVLLNFFLIPFLFLLLFFHPYFFLTSSWCVVVRGEGGKGRGGFFDDNLTLKLNAGCVLDVFSFSFSQKKKTKQKKGREALFSFYFVIIIQNINGVIFQPLFFFLFIFSFFKLLLLISKNPPSPPPLLPLSSLSLPLPLSPPPPSHLPQFKSNRIRPTQSPLPHQLISHQMMLFRLKMWLFEPFNYKPNGSESFPIVGEGAVVPNEVLEREREGSWEDD